MTGTLPKPLYAFSRKSFFTENFSSFSGFRVDQERPLRKGKGVRIKSAENLGPTYRTRVETLVIRHVKPKDPLMKGNS